MVTALVIIGIACLYALAFSLCRMAAPATEEEQRLDDEAQIEYLRRFKD